MGGYSSFHEMRLAFRGLKLRLRIHPERMFVPNLVSLASAAAMRVLPGEVFCDVCCGSGLHAITAALLGARRAYGVDMNAEALDFARRNAELNGVGGKCRFLKGDLLRPLVAKGVRVDSMVFSGPQCPSSYAARPIPVELRTAVDGGRDGSAVSVRFVREAAMVLTDGGRFYLPTAGWAGPSATLRALRDGGFSFRTLYRMYTPVWGRGNNSRKWFGSHPGRRHIGFSYPEVSGGYTRILEAGPSSVFARSGSVVKSLGMDVDFKTGKLPAGRAL